MSKVNKLDAVTGNLRAIFLRYLFPSIAATVMISINFFVDTLCIGQKLGEGGLASLNIALPATGILYAFGCLLGQGGATLFSNCIGRGEKKEARQYFTLAAMVAFLLSATVMLLGIIFLPQVTTFLGGVGQARQGAMDYLTFVFWFAPLFTAEMFLNIFVRNDGAPRLSMVATFCGSGTNIVLDLLFVFVFDWGMKGASLATSLSRLLSTGVLIISMFRKNSNLRFAAVKKFGKKLLRVTRVGLPSFVLEMTGAIVTLTFNTVLLRLSGETAVAVYGVIANLTVVVSSALSGVSNAMQPLVSVNVGARKLSRVRQIFRLAIFSSVGLSCVLLAIGELAPNLLVALFIQADSTFTQLACTGIRIVFISYLLAGINILISVYFQSTQAANEALVLSLMRGIVSPVVCVLGCAFFWGVNGVWVSTILAEILTFSVGITLYIRVQKRLRDKNYEPLGYFDSVRPEETLDTILDRLGAEDLATFEDLITRCAQRNEDKEAIPTYLGLDDLTVSNRDRQFTPAESDQGLGLVLAVGGMLFASLYEQKETEIIEVDPPVAKAMTALAEKCFCFEQQDNNADGASDDFAILPYELVRATWPNENKHNQ